MKNIDLLEPEQITKLLDRQDGLYFELFKLNPLNKSHRNKCFKLITEIQAISKLLKG